MSRLRAVTTIPNNPCGEIRLLRTQSSLVDVITFFLYFNGMQPLPLAAENEYGGRLCRNGDRDVTDLLIFYE